MSSTNHPLTPSNKGGSNKSSTTMIMHTDPNQWYRCTGDIHDFHAEVNSSPSPLSSHHHHHYQSHHHHHAGGAFPNHNNMYDPNNNGRLMMMSLPMIPNVTTPTATTTAMAVVPPPQTISSSSVVSSSTSTTKKASSKSSKNNNKSKQSNNNANATKQPRRILKLDKYESLPEHTVILGRGRESKENPGNIKLHTLALMYLDEYSMAEKNKNMKSKLVKQIVQLVENNSCSTNDKNNIPGFVKRNKNGEWEEVSYAAAREKVGYTFRDLLADRYRSSSKSKVARLRASRATITTSTSSLEQPDGAPTSDGSISNVVVSSTSSPKPLLEDDDAPSVTTTTTPNKPCESDENPLEWRDDPNNVSLKSVFDEVLFAGVDMIDDEGISKTKKKKTIKKRKGASSSSLIKPLSVQSSSFLNAAASSVFLSSDSTDPIKLSEFEHVFCQVFGERLVAAAPIAAAAAASSPATKTKAAEPLPSATARLRPRKRRAVCNFIVRSGEKNSM